MIVRPMTRSAEKFREMLVEADKDNPGAGWVTTRAAVLAGVEGIVDSVAVLIDAGTKIRAEWHRAGDCCRYRLLASKAEAPITSVAMPRSEVKNAASRGLGKAVWAIMQDGEWHTPEAVGDAIGISALRASAAFRRFGYSDRVRFKVEKRWTGQGQNSYEYRITKAVV